MDKLSHKKEIKRLSDEVQAIIKKGKAMSLKREQEEEIANIQKALPFTEGHILTPTLIVRISPFKPLKRGQQRIFHKEKILYRNQFGYIKYTGQTLGMDDQDVFLQLLKMAREDLLQQKEVIKLEFSLRWFLKDIGKPVGGTQIKQLKSILDRLTATSIQVNNKQGRTFAGSFMNSWGMDEDSGKCLVWLNPYISQFYFKFGGYTQLDFNQRQLLKGDIAKALHMFLSSQRNKEYHHDFEYSLQDLAEILNLEGNQEKWKLRQTIKKALEQLEQGYFLKYFNISGNMVYGRIKPH